MVEKGRLQGALIGGCQQGALRGAHLKNSILWDWVRVYSEFSQVGPKLGLGIKIREAVSC